MTDCSHQDITRRKVGITALGVAALRAIETEKPPQDRIINDPYANELSSSDGYTWVDNLTLPVTNNNNVDTNNNSNSDTNTSYTKEDLRVTMVNGLAIRTRKIDELMMYGINKYHYKQIIVPAAGLDSRPWRLNQYFNANVSAISNENDDQDQQQVEDCVCLQDVNWFELDFPEMFIHKFDCINKVHNIHNIHDIHDSSVNDNDSDKVKDSALTASESVCCGSYCAIQTDLSLSNWPELLQTTPSILSKWRNRSERSENIGVINTNHNTVNTADAIDTIIDTSNTTNNSNNSIKSLFNMDTPSIWLLEGFTSYLTTDELTTFFTNMSAHTASGSLLIVTFITKSNSMVSISTHRSLYTDPDGFIAQFGYVTQQMHELNGISDISDISDSDGDSGGGSGNTNNTDNTDNGDSNNSGNGGSSVYKHRKSPIASIWDGYVILVAKKI